jgi:hypothetical protein
MCASAAKSEGNDPANCVTGQHMVTAVHWGECGKRGLTPITVELGPGLDVPQTQRLVGRRRLARRGHPAAPRLNGTIPYGPRSGAARSRSQGPTGAVFGRRTPTTRGGHPAARDRVAPAFMPRPLNAAQLGTGSRGPTESGSPGSVTTCKSATAPAGGTVGGGL